MLYQYFHSSYLDSANTIRISAKQNSLLSNGNLTIWCVVICKVKTLLVSNGNCLLLVTLIQIKIFGCNRKSVIHPICHNFVEYLVLWGPYHLLSQLTFKVLSYASNFNVWWTRPKIIKKSVCLITVWIGCTFVHSVNDWIQFQFKIFELHYTVRALYIRKKRKAFCVAIFGDI